jgi:hypothetical protein
MKVNNFVNK